MKQYNLGPNGGIVTALNLFATRFDQVTQFDPVPLHHFRVSANRQSPSAVSFGVSAIYNIKDLLTLLMMLTTICKDVLMNAFVL